MRTTAVIAALLLTGCVADGDGDKSPAAGDQTYSVHREVTEWEPSPNFEVPADLDIRLSDSSAWTSVGDYPNGAPAAWTGSHVAFMDSETWRSSDGDAATTLMYQLDRSDAGLTGTITAHVIFDSAMGFFDFDFAFAVTPR